jgi:hypothetical protein
VYGFKLAEHDESGTDAVDDEFYKIGKSGSDVVIDSDMP